MANFDCLLSAYFLLATCHTQVACSLRPGAFTKDVSPINSLGTRLGWVHGDCVKYLKVVFFCVTHYHRQIKHTMDKILCYDATQPS